MTGFWKDMVRSFKELWEIRHIPEIYKVFFFILLRGITTPSFGDFWYYYLTNIRDFSQFTVGFLAVLGNISLLLGSIMYAKYFFKWEFRSILAISNFIVFMGGFLGAIFVLNLHQMIGLNDIAFFGIQAFFEDALVMAFVDLPAMVLFAKVTPKHIEGTVFAFLTGTINFSNGVISPTVGSLLNQLFVGVTRENMTADNFIKLVSIETVMSIVPLIFMKLIPSKN